MPILRDFFISLSHNKRLERFLTSNRFGRKISRRFVAGETLEELVDIVKKLEREGIHTSVAFLGEHYRSKEPALRSTKEYLRLAEALSPHRDFSEISLKLTQIGLEIDKDFTYSNLKKIGGKAKKLGLYVNVDVEEFSHLEDTMDIVTRLNDESYPIGTVIQAYLYKSNEILERLSKYKMNIRLVKGAYKEPPDMAYQKKRDVDENYKRLAVRMLELSDKIYPEFATHDETIIRFIERKAQEMGISKDRFEFQMLYGVRLGLQKRVKKDYKLRLYVPYGSHWYPYFMRRLAERPANVWFILRGLFG